MTPAAHPSAEPPVHPADLPRLDQLVLDALVVEHGKSVDLMGQTLLAAGWRPEQVAHVQDHWSWTQIARAVAWERGKRGEAIVHPRSLAEVERVQPGAVAARAEAAWVAKHGEIAPPRPPTPGGPIRLPARPADVSRYALDPIDPDSQGERL